MLSLYIFFNLDNMTSMLPLSIFQLVSIDRYVPKYDCKMCVRVCIFEGGGNI